ncbi:MAG: glycoside hydrolase family 15 protein [Bacillota bacterium]
MAKPYLINAVVGNARMLATLDARGEMHRLYWPHVDYPQHVDRMFGGLFMSDYGHCTFWLNNEEHWHHEQKLAGDAPVCVTEARGRHMPVKITAMDYVVPGQDVLVRNYIFENLSPDTISFRFLHFTSLFLDSHSVGNAVLYHPNADAVVHYRHGYAFAVGATLPTAGYQCGGALHDAADGHLCGSPNSLDSEGCLVWDIDNLAGNQTREMTLFIAAGRRIETALTVLERSRQAGHRLLMEQAMDWWAQFWGADETADDGLYRRSLAVCRLLTDEETGAVIAAPEIDEHYTKCGGYGYCWPRDGVIVACAMGRAGYAGFSAQFYRWCLAAQAENGSWLQRYDATGFLGPSWGHQIDETGSVLWGMWQHYLQTGDDGFLQEVWPALARGADYLCDNIDPHTDLPAPSFDLWEERVGEHAYSAAAVAAGLRSAAVIAARLGQDGPAARWVEAAETIGNGIVNSLWSEERGHFLRTVMKKVSHEEYCGCLNAGQEAGVTEDSKGYRGYFVKADEVVDASLLGLVYPYGILPPDDPRVAKTVAAIEARLTSPGVGGIKRYENDHYIGGNPWIITTLWLALFHIAAGNRDEAAYHLKWVQGHQTDLGYLSEQICRESGRPNWVIPLTWSHAMYILTVVEMKERGWL